MLFCYEDEYFVKAHYDFKSECYEENIIKMLLVDNMAVFVEKAFQQIVGNSNGMKSRLVLPI